MPAAINGIKEGFVSFSSKLNHIDNNIILSVLLPDFPSGISIMPSIYPNFTAQKFNYNVYASILVIISYLYFEFESVRL
jgi:hypothetical protein